MMITNLTKIFEDYMENIDFTITEAIQKPDSMDIILFYQFSPYLAMTTQCMDAHIKEATDANNDKWLHVLYGAKIVRIIKRPYPISEAKALLMGIRKELSNSKIDFQNLISYIDTTINNIRKHQYESAQLESAILHYSAIVPYTQVIKKPGMETADVDQDKLLQQKELITNVGDEISKENLLEKIEKLFDNILPSILINWASLLNTIDEFFYKVIANNQEEVYTYFILVYWYTKFDIIAGSRVVKFNETINTMFTTNRIECDVLLEALTELSGNNFDSRNVDEERIRYESDRQLRKKESLSADGGSFAETFDLTKIESFINRHYGRFVSNEYANTLFTEKNQQIDSYIAAVERMVYIMDDDTVCTAVIDKGDFDRVKLICLTRSGEISIKNYLSI